MGVVMGVVGYNSMCPLCTLQGVPVLLKSGLLVHGSIMNVVIGDYGLNVASWECNK